MLRGAGSRELKDKNFYAKLYKKYLYSRECSQKTSKIHGMTDKISATGKNKTGMGGRFGGHEGGAYSLK